MRHAHMDYPALEPAHFNNARAFSDRASMLLSLRPEKGLVIGEIGVGFGGFSAFFLEHMQPSKFVAVDLFDFHATPEIWGRSTAAVFSGGTHRAYYENRFAYAGDVVTVEQGLSHERIAAYPDAFFDILYVDAGHTYEDVTRDAAAGAPKVRPDGLLVFNDYTLYDHMAEAPYGVVQAVNELIAASDWQVVGFALHRHMYCDIALRRPV